MNTKYCRENACMALRTWTDENGNMEEVCISLEMDSIVISIDFQCPKLKISKFTMIDEELQWLTSQAEDLSKIYITDMEKKEFPARMGMNRMK